MLNQAGTVADKTVENVEFVPVTIQLKRSDFKRMRRYSKVKGTSIAGSIENWINQILRIADGLKADDAMNNSRKGG